MKAKYFWLAVGALCLTACGHKHSDDEVGHHHDHPETETGSEITLAPQSAERFGVRAEAVSIGAFRPAITVAGEIVDTPNSSSAIAAPTSGVVKYAPHMMDGTEVRRGEVVAHISASSLTGGDANAVALAALEAAKAELDRITPLYEERIVTAKTYAEAEQAYKQAKAAYSASAASGQAVSPIDGVVTRMLVQEGEYVEAGTPIAVACSEEMLTLRADLPERFRSRLPQISSANVADPITGQVYSLDEMGAKRITSPKGIASQRGYVPLYFTFDNNGQLTHGSYLKVYLLGEPVEGAMSVPLSALSEQQGAYFVYRQIDDDCYEKIPVKIGANDGTNVEILSGLNGDEQIVVDGVVAVRLAESSRVAPEGHSHNH